MMKSSNSSSTDTIREHCLNRKREENKVIESGEAFNDDDDDVDEIMARRRTMRRLANCLRSVRERSN